MINGTDASTFAGDGEATIFRSGWTYVAIGLMGLRSIKRAQRRTGEAVGEVTTRDKGWWHEDPQVKVQFRAHTGQLVTISTDRRRYEIGDSVDVVYDPADCENARVKPDAAGLSAPRRRAVFVLFILLGLGWELFRWSR
jgi:uncharacterized protein DUF3592